MALRRPPPVVQGLMGGGRRGSGGPERARTGDEASLREELNHLRGAADALKREESEVWKCVRRREQESHEKDKQLQELLANATGGSGVPGEALDQLREDLQLLLHVKSRIHDARQQLDDKEQKLVTIAQELKATQTYALEEEVEAAKAEAKRKADEWLHATCTSSNKSHQLRKAGEDLLAKIQDVENEIARSHRRRSTMEDERTRYEQETQTYGEQIEQLQEKRGKVEQQMEDCRSSLEGLDTLRAERDALKSRVSSLSAEVKRKRQDGIAEKLKQSLQPRLAEHKLHGDLLKTGFVPLLPSAAPAQASLLWRLKHAFATPSRPSISGLTAMLAEDTDDDGLLSPEEFCSVVKRLGLVRTTVPDIVALFGALSEALLRRGQLSLVDFAMALPLHRLPEPPEAELQAVRTALLWGCRRWAVSEGWLRQTLLAWLDVGVDIAQESAALCARLGLESHVGGSLARGLEVQREGFLAELPSWPAPCGRSRAAVLLRFLRDLAAQRDVLASSLDREALPLEDFLKISSRLGPCWSANELEEVALAAESGGSTSGPPRVDGERLVRALAPGAFAKVFPDMLDACKTEALEELETAAKARPRRHGAAANPAAVTAPPLWPTSPQSAAAVPLASPLAPLAPASPLASASPLAPAGPLTPAGPLAPASPLATASPLAPLGAAPGPTSTGPLAGGACGAPLPSQAGRGEPQLATRAGQEQSTPALAPLPPLIAAAPAEAALPALMPGTPEAASAAAGEGAMALVAGAGGAAGGAADADDAGGEDEEYEEDFAEDYEEDFADEDEDEEDEDDD